MSVVESARFMSVVTMAMVDSIIAIMDAKYTYEFWRPITAIRNGDIDDNPATERVADWQPFGITTPMHPEYPCAHCVISGAVAGSIERQNGAFARMQTDGAIEPCARHLLALNAPCRVAAANPQPQA